MGKVNCIKQGIIEKSERSIIEKMNAIIYQHGGNDFEIWFPDLSIEDEEKIEAILDKYRNTGYSARGTAQDIVEEL